VSILPFAPRDAPVSRSLNVHSKAADSTQSVAGGAHVRLPRTVKLHVGVPQTLISSRVEVLGATATCASHTEIEGASIGVGGLIITETFRLGLADESHLLLRAFGRNVIPGDGVAVSVARSQVSAHVEDGDHVLWVVHEFTHGAAVVQEQANGVRYRACAEGTGRREQGLLVA
jgi:hypothetical protein